MPNQFNQWEREYNNPKFLTKDSKPQSDTVKFAKFLRKNGIDFENSRLVDLGSGTGRNGNFFAEKGCEVFGIELSKTATDIANDRAKQSNLNAVYVQGDMGEKLPYNSEYFDIAIDVMSSNSLSSESRDIFVNEIYRILKPNGFVFIKALCKDGDTNAKELIKRFPGGEVDTYIMPETEIVERVFSEKDFKETYAKKFKILNLEKKTNYFKMGDRNYKRNYWIYYMQK